MDARLQRRLLARGEVLTVELLDKVELRALLGRGFRRRVPHRHAPSEAGGRVGHAADNLRVAERPSQRGRRGAGQDRNHELARLQHHCQLRTHPAKHLGLDREQYDIGVRDRLTVGGHGSDPVRLAELVAALRPRMAGHDLGRLDDAASKQAGNHGLGHDA